VSAEAVPYSRPISFGGNSPSYYYALCAATAKLWMDFLVPSRELNFLAFNALLVLMFLALRPRIYLDKNGRILFWVASFCLLFQLARVPDNSISYKLATLPFLVVLFYSVGRGLSDSATKKCLSYIFSVFVMVFFCNYAISSALGLTAHREFWNFEHANLLGSYVLVIAVLAHYLILRERRLRGRLIVFVVVLTAFLSTSTGALLLSIGVLIRLRGFKAGSVAAALLLGLVLLGAGILLLSFIDVVTYEKIVGPVRLVWNGGWARLVNEARSGGRHYLSGEWGARLIYVADLRVSCLHVLCT
jgi:hypothetical protein